MAHEKITLNTTHGTERWVYDSDSDSLQPSPIGRLAFQESAHERVAQIGRQDSPELLQVIALAVDRQREEALSKNERVKQDLNQIDAVIAARGSNPDIESVRERVLRTLRPVEPEELMKSQETVSTVAAELEHQDAQSLNLMIRARVGADTFPWTMPNMHLSSEVVGRIKDTWEGLTVYDEPKPDDTYKVAPPMKQFEGGRYAPDDEILLRRAGVGTKGNYYRRDELQKAGVFFVNRVGGGEQPLFGAPIPDPESAGGVFNLQDRSFLTKEEFEKVYAYQQAHGFGIDGNDPKDVQLDMVMFAVLPEGGRQSLGKGAGFGSRENKYGLVRSPFVDLGFCVKNGVESMFMSRDGATKYRINTTSIYLAGGHPEYPGVSEMAGTQVAHDQRYISAGEFVRSFYQPLPSSQEVLACEKMGIPTKREQVWGIAPSS